MMTIKNMRLEWIPASGEYFQPPEKGIIISATGLRGLFADPPELNIAAVSAEGQGGIVKKKIGLFVACNVSLEKVFNYPPESPAPMKLVGDPKRGTARRVYEFIGKDSGLDFRLGLTIHEARGTWSSEPHDFELEALKSLKPMRFWEQFAYITDPPNEWGIQIRQGFLNGEFMQDQQVIRDRDILSIPLGVHMVTAGPGVKLAYIWVYQAEDISSAEKF
jgi:hypothetical protein